MGAWLTTRETVADALDINTTANADRHIDRAAKTATHIVEAFLRRRFVPEQDTKYVEWPARDGGNPYWICRLGYDEVVSVTAVTAGGTAMSGYLLEPDGAGPPYTRIEMPRTGSGFEYGDTPQRNIAITGVFAYSDDRETVGTLPANLTDSATSLTLASEAVGVGSMLVINAERVTVTEREFADTTFVLTNSPTASMSSTTVSVDDATGFAVGEHILIDSERMRVDAIAGLDLTVRRAQDGTVLAAHTSTTAVWANRALTIERGAQGTTAAAHTLGDTIERWVPPAPVEALATAEAIALLEQDRAGWARTVGSGDNESEARGTGVQTLRRTVYRTHGRRMRIASA